MIPTATLSPMLPTQARSTTVQNGLTPGDFAGSFAQANDDAAASTAPAAAAVAAAVAVAADGASKTPTPTIAIPALPPGTIARQDAAVTGNTLPIPGVTEAAQAIVPKIAPLLAEPLAVGQRPAPVALAQLAIPTKTDPAVPDVATKRPSAARPATPARPAAFAVLPRTGKGKTDAPTTPSDDAADTPPTDQPALPVQTALPLQAAPPLQTAIDPPVINPPAITVPVVAASPDALPAAPFTPAPPAKGTTTIVAEYAVAPGAAVIGGVKPIATAAVAAPPPAATKSDLATPTPTPTPRSTTPAPRQSRDAAQLAQAEPSVPTTIPRALRPVVQRSPLPVATASARPAADMVDLGQMSAPQVTPVAQTPAILAATPPVTTPSIQIVALAAPVPVAQQVSSETGSPLPAQAPVSETAPIATPRWVATDATTPVALAVAQPVAAQPQPGTVASASQVFGAAIQAATKPRDERDAIDPTAPSLAAGAPVSPPTIKTAEAQQAPLDMRQERWPHAMIDRIAILRDAADATDTRIRLIPDALGAIDVSMRKDGDTVHVQFNAEQASTRTLLQDAQPRLAELAEARGLKLGQGALGDSAAGANQHRAPAAPQIPNRPPLQSATAATAVIADAHEDTRIA